MAWYKLQRNYHNRPGLGDLWTCCVSHSESSLEHLMTLRGDILAAKGALRPISRIILPWLPSGPRSLYSLPWSLTSVFLLFPRKCFSRYTPSLTSSQGFKLGESPLATPLAEMRHNCLTGLFSGLRDWLSETGSHLAAPLLDGETSFGQLQRQGKKGGKTCHPKICLLCIRDILGCFFGE